MAFSRFDRYRKINKKPAAMQPVCHISEMFVLNQAEVSIDLADLGTYEQSALPQRAWLIFSFSASAPTAPMITCLPMT